MLAGFLEPAELLRHLCSEGFRWRHAPHADVALLPVVTLPEWHGRELACCPRAELLERHRCVAPQAPLSQGPHN